MPLYYPDLQRHSFFRPVDWRWQRACALLERGRYFSPRRDDQQTGRALQAAPSVDPFFPPLAVRSESLPLLLKGMTMNITFGEYEGKSAAYVVLADPLYVLSVLQQESSNPRLQRLQRSLWRRIDEFDAFPIQKRCSGLDCGATSTCCSIEYDRNRPSWWCDACAPRQVPGYTLICLYLSLVDYSIFVGCEAHERVPALLLKIARAKGMWTQLTEANAKAFFERGVETLAARSNSREDADGRKLRSTRRGSGRSY